MFILTQSNIQSLATSLDNIKRSAKKLVYTLFSTSQFTRILGLDLFSNNLALGLECSVQLIFTLFWMRMYPYTYLCPSARLPIPVSFRIINATSISHNPPHAHPCFVHFYCSMIFWDYKIYTSSFHLLMIIY